MNVQLDIVNALTPAAAALAVAAVKLIAPRIPKWLLPVLAGLFGGVADSIAAFIVAHQSSFWVGTALGGLGVWLREIIDQLKKYGQNPGR